MHFLPYVVALLVLMTAVALHEFGHFIVAKLCGLFAPTFSIGFGPALIKFNWKGTEFRISPILLGGYVELPEMQETLLTPEERKAIEEKYGRKLTRPSIPKRMATAVAGPAANVVSAWLAVVALLMFVGAPQLTNAFLTVNQVVAGSPAAQAGIQPGDQFVSIDGQKAGTMEELGQALAAGKDHNETIVVLRNGQSVTLTAKPDEAGHLGVVLKQGGDTHYQRGTFVQSVKVANNFEVGFAKAMGNFLAQLVHLKPVPAGQPKPVDQLQGPVQIIQLIADSSTSVFALVEIFAILSVNLAFMNLLPFAPLDGGWIFFFTLEAIFRKPVPAKIQQKATTVGWLLLMGLMLWTTFKPYFH